MMKSKLFTLALSAILTFTMVGVQLAYVDDAFAKGFSSSSSSFSRSSFSRSSSSRSSSSWGSGSSSKTKSSSPKTSGGFWGGKSSNKTSSIKTGGNKTASISSGGNRSASTKKVWKQQQSKFKKPVTVPGVKTTAGKPLSRTATNTAYRNNYKSNPVYSRASDYDSSTYYSRRNRYYGAGYEPPVYVYNSSPSFGMWDTIFLYSLLNNNNHGGNFAYNHQNDPDYQAWRREAEEQAKTNAELRAQLASMDAQSAQLAGTPIDSGYLPKGVDADIALSQGARQAALPDFRVCTGGTDGAYFFITTGLMGPQVDSVNIVPVITAGTGQALEYIAADKCDAAWVQANGYWNYIEDNSTVDLPFTRLFSPFREDIEVICNEDSDIDDIFDITSKNTILFPKGSGAATTMRDWIGEDERYADIRTVLTDATLNVPSNNDALLMVSQNKDMCMMYVSAPGATKFMKQANASSRSMKTVLIDVDDDVLEDKTDPSGKDVYKADEIDEDEYPNLTRQAGYFWGAGDIHTYSVAADFIVADAWKKKNPDIASNVSIQIIGLENRIKLLLKR